MQSFVPRDAFVLKIQRDLCHLKCAKTFRDLRVTAPGPVCRETVLIVRQCWCVAFLTDLSHLESILIIPRTRCSPSGPCHQHFNCFCPFHYKARSTISYSTATSKFIPTNVLFGYCLLYDCFQVKALAFPGPVQMVGAVFQNGTLIVVTALMSILVRTARNVRLCDGPLQSLLLKRRVHK